MLRIEKLNELVDGTELRIREFICGYLLDNNLEKLEELVPHRIIEKVNERIKAHLNKFKHINEEKYDDFRKEIEFLDVSDYGPIIWSEKNWRISNEIFQSKPYDFFKKSLVGLMIGV